MQVLSALPPASHWLAPTALIWGITVPSDRLRGGQRVRRWGRGALCVPDPGTGARTRTRVKRLRSVTNLGEREERRRKGGITTRGGRGNRASRNSGWREAWGWAVTAETQGSGLKSGRVKFLGGRVRTGWGHLQAVGESLEPQVVAQEGLGTGQRSRAAHWVPAFLQCPQGKQEEVAWITKVVVCT